VWRALRNGDLCRATLAYAASVISEWSLGIGLLVYAYEHGGATTVGLTSLGVLVPSILIAPWTGRAADGPRPNRLVAVVYMVQAVALVVAAMFAFAGAPAVVAIVMVAVSVTASAFIRPAFSVVVPGLVTSASELTAANLLAGYCDSISILLGPLIASALLVVEGPATVFAACAGLAVLGTALTVPLIRLDPPPLPAGLQVDAPTTSLIGSVRGLAERPGAISLLTVLGGQYVLIGALDMLYVILAVEVLDMGDSGPGYLSALFGFGALAGGAASTVLVGRRRLAPLLVVTMLVIIAGMLTLGATTTLVAAVIVLPLIGLSRTVLDLTGRMLLQRAAPQDALASVFAVMEASTTVGEVVGTVLVQITVAASGPRGAVAAVGAVMGVLLIATARQLQHIDASADAPVVKIRQLRVLPIFAPLPGPELEGIARAAKEISVPAGEPIVHEGDVGHHYYAITSGQVDVSMNGHHVRTMGRGQGFGEIALLADVPRTASAVAADDVTLLSIGRVPFLTAVTGHDVSARTAWSVARDFHPSLTPDDS
jgi:predicted MFS family arabinose efflux permease